MSVVKDEINKLRDAYAKEYPNVKINKESGKQVKDFFRINEIKVPYQVTLAEDGFYRVIFHLPSMLNRGEKVAFTFLGDDKMNCVTLLWDGKELVTGMELDKPSSEIINLPCMMRVINWKFIQ